MANEILKTLLKEYEEKKERAEAEAEEKKDMLYKKIPNLSEIEENLNKCSINKAKQILNGNKEEAEKYDSKIQELKKQKAEVLKQNNITAESLEPQYECKNCKDTGYIVDQNYKTQMCYCLKQKLFNIAYNKSNITNLAKENFSTFDISLFSDETYEKYNMSPRENIEYIKNKCIEFVNNFDSPDQKNLLFTGNVGVRKNIYDKLHSKRIARQAKNSVIPNSSNTTRNSNKL